MKKLGEWASDLELSVANEIFKIKIELYQVKEIEQTLLKHVYNKEKNYSKTVKIGYLKLSKHYNSIIPFNEKEIIEKDKSKEKEIIEKEIFEKEIIEKGKEKKKIIFHNNDNESIQNLNKKKKEKKYEKNLGGENYWGVEIWKNRWKTSNKLFFPNFDSCLKEIKKIYPNFDPFNLLIIARDVEAFEQKKNLPKISKCFSFFNNLQEFKIWYNNVKEEDRHFYEIIFGISNFYCDLDGIIKSDDKIKVNKFGIIEEQTKRKNENFKKIDSNPEKTKKFFEFFKEKIKEELKDQIPNEFEIELKILDSSVKGKKVSFHIISNIYSEIKDVKSLFLKLIQVISNSEYKEYEDEDLFDYNVYKINGTKQFFRMGGSSKKSNNIGEKKQSLIFPQDKNINNLEEFMASYIDKNKSIYFHFNFENNNKQKEKNNNNNQKK
jgi:hypothetical protein